MRSEDGKQWWDGTAWRALSPDGLYYWNSAQWTPIPTQGVGAPTGGAPMKRGRGPLFWILGGCGCLVILAVVGSVLAGNAVRTFLHVGQAGSCAPADLPDYPGSNQVLWGHVGPLCTYDLSTTDSPSTVDSWYESELSQGDWEVVSTSTVNGTIRFDRKSNSKVTGQVQAKTNATGTQIVIAIVGG